MTIKVYGAEMEGFGANASGGQGSHAEGYMTQARGTASHAEGYQSQATTSNAHAEGDNCYASGTGSHAEGGTCYATTSYAHAEGDHCNANGVGSHAEGGYTTASQYATHAGGVRSTADAYGQWARGGPRGGMYLSTRAQTSIYTYGGVGTTAAAFHLTLSGDQSLYSNIQNTVPVPTFSVYRGRFDWVVRRSGTTDMVQAATLEFTIFRAASNTNALILGSETSVVHTHTGGTVGAMAITINNNTILPVFTPAATGTHHAVGTMIVAEMTSPT